MCGPYWSQWDRSELDSMQGKDLVVEEEDDIDFSPDEEEEDEECSCCCDRNPCGRCMDCLGMSWKDFF